MKKSIFLFILLLAVLISSTVTVSAEDLYTVTEEQMLQIVNLVRMVSGDDVTTEDQLAKVLSTLKISANEGSAVTQAEPAAQPEITGPQDCFLPKANVGEDNMCWLDDMDPEYSVKIVWLPRLATHISGIAASGTFVYIRFEITNLTDKPWDGLKASSFKLIEDVEETGIRMEFPLNESTTRALCNSYELNKLTDMIMPKQTVSLLLSFDVSTKDSVQQFVFSPVDRSGHALNTRMILPLPRYTWRLN